MHPTRAVSSVAILLSFAALAAFALAGEPPPPPVFDYDAAEKALAGGTPSETDARALIRRATDALARRTDLAREAAGKGRVSFSMAAQAKVENWLGLGASAGMGHSGGQFSLGHRLLRFKGSADPTDRSVTSQIEMAVGLLGDGTVVKRAYSVKLEYADNRTYLRALGVDARNLPGMTSVVQLMNRLTGGEAEEVRQAGGPYGVKEAVASELSKLLPDMFQAATEFKRFTVGSGTVIESPGGDVAISHMKQELLEQGQAEGEGRKWSEVSVGADLDATLAAGKAAKVSGGVSLEIKRTYGDPPPTDDAANATALDLFAQGDLEGLYAKARDRLAPTVDPERMQKGLEALEGQGEPAAAGSDRVVAARDEDIGGVRIQYDPAMLRSAVAPATAARMLDRIVAGLESGREGFVVLPDGGSLALHVVSLARALDRGDASLGAITRLRGSVRTPDDLLLLGEAEPGVPAIALDTLTVAARNVWREGAFPFISLDPDPADFTGPQVVRIGGVLESLRETHFVRVMVDADYEMKRIDMGVERLDIPGFLSLREIVAVDPPPRPITARAWLTPMQSTIADVWTWRQGEREAWLFDTRVQVLSEAMRRTRDGLMGGGEVDPYSARAADELTGRYDDVVGKRPVFGELRGLFSAVKLCAVLRARGVEMAVLDRLADRAPERVGIPSTYAGISVADGPLHMSGGAMSRVRLARGAFRDAPELADLLAARSDSVLDAAFPTTVGLSATEAAEADGALHANRGLATFQALDYAACERHMDAALERDDALVEPRLLRGVCRFARGDVPGALADIEAVLPELPHVVALRGLLRAIAGDDAAASADLEIAAERFAANDDVLAWRAQAHLYLGQYQEAERLAIALLRRNPDDPGAEGLWEMLSLLHRIGPTEARIRMSHLRRVPLEITEAYAAGSQALATLDFRHALESLEQCLHLVDARADDPHVAALELRERCELGLVFAHMFADRVAEALDAGKGRDVPSARPYTERLLRRHPDWPTAHLLDLMTLPDADGSALARKIEEVLVLERHSDPLLADLGALLGTDRVSAWMAFSLLRQALEKDLPPELRARLLARAIEALGPGYEARLLDVLLANADASPQVFAPRFREVLLEMPVPLPSDAVTAQVVGFSLALYEGMAKDMRSEDAHRAVVARRFLEASDVATLPPPAWQQVSAYRFAAMMEAFVGLEAERREDPALKRLKLAVANRRIPLVEVRRQAQSLADAYQARVVEAVGPFLAQWTAWEGGAAYDMDLLDAAARLTREVPAGAEREAYESEIQAWREEIVGRMTVGELKQRQIESTEAIARANRSMVESVERFSASAKRPAEIHMLAFLGRVFATALGVMAEQDPETAAQMRPWIEKLTAGLSGEGLVLTPRDWERWGDPAASSPTRREAAGSTVAVTQGKTPAAPPPGVEESGGPDPGLLAGGAVLLGLLVLGLALRARRRA